MFKISGEIYETDIMIGYDGVQPWDGAFNNLPDHDVLVVGTGKTQIFPDAKTRAEIPMEVMATDAACRTYNALISDGRRVLACLKRAL